MTDILTGRLSPAGFFVGIATGVSRQKITHPEIFIRFRDVFICNRSGLAYAKPRAILFTSEFLVRLETDLRELFSLLEKLLSSLREEFVERCETNLALQEVLELGPIRFLAVE